MIDVHVPEPTHSWKDFFIHIATISVGLLIAIGLEQTVEAIHRAHQRQELIDDFHVECRNNLKVMDEGFVYYKAMIEWDDAALKALNSAPVVNGEVSVIIPERANVPIAKSPSRAVWTVAKSNGKVALLPEDLAEVYDRVDHEGEEFDRTNNRNIDAGDKIKSVVKAAGMRFTLGSTVSLTVAQRDQLLEAFAAAEVEETNSRYWLANWQGASQAVLDGVSKREDMDDYMLRAFQALQ